MLTARDLHAERESHGFWLRTGLFLLLLLAVCCAAPAERRLLGSAIMTAPVRASAARGVRPADSARLNGLALRLNLPAFRLDVLTADGVARSYAVAVGATRFETPRGEFEITREVELPRPVPFQTSQSYEATRCSCIPMCTGPRAVRNAPTCLLRSPRLAMTRRKSTELCSIVYSRKRRDDRKLYGSIA